MTKWCDARGRDCQSSQSRRSDNALYEDFYKAAFSEIIGILMSMKRLSMSVGPGGLQN